MDTQKKIKPLNLTKLLPKVKKSVEEILELIGLKGYSLKLTISEKKWIQASIEHSKQGILIGRNGETLLSLQTILRLILFRDHGEWVPFVLNIGDYLEKRKEYLEKWAQNLAQKTKFTNTAQEINNLNSAERRLIHLYLKDHPDVETESVDTEFGRKLLIKPKS